MHKTNDPRLIRIYLKGYAETRTDGSSSVHKLPTKGELIDAASMTFDEIAVREVFDELVQEGFLKKQGPYYGTKILDVL